MKTVLAVLAMGVFAGGMAAATDKSDVMAVVHQYTDAFNKGDPKSGLAVCADESIIIDDFPPHEWSGTGACAKWQNDFTAFAQKAQLTEAMIALSKPRHLDVTADRAYVVIPVSLTYKEQGKAKRETGATWTFALQKLASGWRITGWAWSAGKEADAETPAGH